MNAHRQQYGGFATNRSGNSKNIWFCHSENLASSQGAFKNYSPYEKATKYIIMLYIFIFKRNNISERKSKYGRGANFFPEKFPLSPRKTPTHAAACLPGMQAWEAPKPHTFSLHLWRLWGVFVSWAPKQLQNRVPDRQKWAEHTGHVMLLQAKPCSFHLLLCAEIHSAIFMKTQDDQSLTNKKIKIIN